MFDELKKIKDDGMKGLNKGIKFPLDRLSSYVPNIQKSRLYLIGALSGGGKTKVANELFVYNAYDEIIKNNYNAQIVYWSLELPKLFITAGLIVRWLQNTHDIIIDTNILLSVGENKLPPFINELIESDDCRQYVYNFYQIVDVRDDKLSYINASNQIEAIAEDNGQNVFTTVTHGDKQFKKFVRYEEKDPQKYTIFMIDHVSLITPIGGQSKKQAIDELANVFIKARNRYNFTFVVTQQLNRGANSTDRTKLEQFLPKDSDFKDSNGMVEAADIVIGILNPYREGMDSFMGLRIKPNAMDMKQHGFKGRLLILHVIKNRYGTAFITFPILFIGETGIVKHIAKDHSTVDYNEIAKIKKIDT